MSYVNFLEQYEFLQILGQGAGSRVYLARHRVLGTLRAIKALSKSHPRGRGLLKEAQILQNLNHPGIPHVYEVAEDSEQYCLIEEYIPGTSLQTIISSAPDKIPRTDIIRYGMGLCDIISYLHEQKPYPLLYLDFKPEHVICSGGKVYLLDFGSVRQEREWSAGAGIPGTEGFVSPEVKAGKNPTKSSDIYGVGALLFYMATGERYEGRNSFLNQSSAMGEWKKVLGNCLYEETEKRYRDIRTLRNDLKKLGNRGKKEGEMPSLTVAVAGAMERLGVTHTAIGLTAWLNRRKQVALYLDETKNHMVEYLADTVEGAQERQGIIRIGDFLGIPCFGDGVECGIEKFPVQVLDVGAFCNGKEPDEDKRARQMQLCAEADVVLLLLGGREWELEQSRQILLGWSLPQKPVILFRFGVTDAAEKMLKEAKVRKFHTIPYFQKLWKSERQAAAFYEALWKRVVGEKL